MVKVCMKGVCRNVQMSPSNGEPRRCAIQVELDHNVSIEYRLYDVELFVPVEFASLIEAGLPLTLTIEQTET